MGGKKMKSRYKIILYINGTLLFVISTLLIMFISLNAEMWFYGYKINGLLAQQIMYGIGISGIVLGVLQFKRIRKLYFLSVMWWIIILSMIFVNHYTAQFSG